MDECGYLEFEDLREKWSDVDEMTIQMWMNEILNRAIRSGRFFVRATCIQ